MREINIIETHIHLDDSAFDGDRSELIKNLKSDGIELLINVGADMPSSRASVELASENENIYAAIGVHPHDAKNMKDEDFDELRELSENPKVVAIGEIGLDYYYDKSERDIQREIFERQLLLALELNLPIIIHSRDAAMDTLDIVKKNCNGLRGEMHCFSYSTEIMREYVKLGFFIGLGGVVTFKNSKTLKEVSKEVPIEKILLETDAPYLTPEPFRGKRNEPKFIRYSAQKISELRNMPLDDLILRANENARELFKI